MDNWQKHVVDKCKAFVDEDFKRLNKGAMTHGFLERESRGEDVMNSPEYRWYRKVCPGFREFGEGAIWRSWDKEY